MTDNSTDMTQVNSYTVTFPLSKVYEEVSVQSWYQGEAQKRKDADMAIVQSSTDDTTQMQTVVETALNDIVLRMTKRLRDIDWSITDDTVSIGYTPFARVPEGDAERVAAVMGKAIMDYMVNECLVSWFETTAVQHPEIANVYKAKQEVLMDKILNAVSMLSEHPVRRRATNLCGI